MSIARSVWPSPAGQQSGRGSGRFLFLAGELVGELLRFREVERAFVDGAASDGTDDAFLLCRAQGLYIVQVGDTSARDDGNRERRAPARPWPPC